MQDEILTQYEVRKSNKQKSKFITYLKGRLEQLNCPVTIEESGKGILKTRNIVVGNPEKAEVILGAHYDTCAWLPFPNLMTPTNTFAFWGYQILLSAALVGICFTISFLIGIITQNYIIANKASIVIMILLMIQMMVGFGNKHTANDNTSGTILLTHILENLSPQEREKVCVVYFDNEEKGLFGSIAFARKHKKEIKDKLMINFDCVGDGTNVVSIADKKTRNHSLYKSLTETFHQELKENPDYDIQYLNEKLKFMQFPSDQINFKFGVGVCSLKSGRFCLYADKIHTYKDRVCRKENIDYLTNTITSFIKTL